MRLSSLFRRGYTLLPNASDGSPPSKAKAGTTYLRFHLFSLSPWSVLVLSFTTLYLLSIAYCSTHFYRDPTSLFFSKTRGYDKIYSLQREREAVDFLAALNYTDSTGSGKDGDSTDIPEHDHAGQSESRIQPDLCLAIATVQRPNSLYIDKTVGSVLEGLSDDERARLHLMFFIAHVDQSVHEIYDHLWTKRVADTMLTYNLNDTQQVAKIKEWERGGDHRSKGLYDYAFLLKACKERTGAEFVAIMEGDVLAVKGWFSRAVTSAKEVDASVPIEKGTNVEGDAGQDGVFRRKWLYMRMFFTEEYLGWNSEEWPTYLFWSVVYWVAFTGSIIGITALPTPLRRVITWKMVGFCSLIAFPAFVVLYFAAGRMSVAGPSPGVHRMDNFGCCSQGMVFHRDMVDTVVKAIEDRIEGYVDMMFETLANRDGLQRWAVFPSLLQHIGGESSKGDAVADERAKMIWNFGFEAYRKGRTLAWGLTGR